MPLSEDYASAELSAVDSAVGAAPRLPVAAQPNYFSRSGERAALARRTPIWGFSLPQTRPDEYGDRFPRPFRVHNDSRWSESFAAASAPVVQDARTVYNACAWVQTLHNRLLDAEVDRLRGELSARELLNEVIYTRASLHQLFLILVTRYTVLSEQQTNPTLAANLQDLLLAPDDRDSIYRPTTSFLESSVLAHRTFAISREQAERVQDRLRPRRQQPQIPGNPLSASARRRLNRQLRAAQERAGSVPAGGNPRANGAGPPGDAHGGGGQRGGAAAGGIGGGGGGGGNRRGGNGDGGGGGGGRRGGRANNAGGGGANAVAGPEAPVAPP